MILISLDVTKLEKARFFKVIQSITKEERDLGERGNIVGNWRSVSKNHGKPVTPKQPEPQEEQHDIPF